MARRLAMSLAILAAFSTTSLVAQTTPTRFSFGLWGDMPYKKAGDDTKLPAVLRSINQSDIAFSVYDGDIKDGSSHCTNAVYTDALSMFNSMNKAVVYVPGDNEWTDCHRLNNGGFDPLERLSHLRKVLFPDTNSLGKAPIPLKHQGALGEKFVENTRFSYGGIVVVGINQPGSNNNWVLDEKDCTSKSARTALQCEAGNKEHQERDAANRAWLSEAFAAAKAEGAIGVVVVTQGDPGFDLPETESTDESNHPSVSGYRPFMKSLVSQTEQFKGQVLFVHGDTHFFKVDKPLYSPTRLLPNLTRLQTFGSPSLHWVRVEVDPSRQQVFGIEAVIVPQAQ